MARVKVKIDMRNVKINTLIKDLGPDKTSQVLFTSSEHVLVPAIRRKIKENKSVDTGKLFQGIQSKSLIRKGDGAVEVGSLGVEYGLNVEKGTGPHTPDFGRLLDWVRRKVKPRGNPVTATIRISKTIQKRGVKPRPHIIPAFQTNQKRLANDFVTRMRVALRTK